MKATERAYYLSFLIQFYFIGSLIKGSRFVIYILSTASSQSKLVNRIN